MDVTQSLKDAENALRDFIAATLRTKHGDAWIEHIGVPAERIAKWEERKETEAKRQEAGVVEERLLYYADFYDLGTILKKNWQDFTSALGDLKTMEVWLKELERLRDPDAHRRELLPHQKHLIVGISGEIRNRIVRYRSNEDTADAHFPRIESARDSVGNIWTPRGTFLDMVDTGRILRPGDVIDFVVTASDPLGQQLYFAVSFRAYDKMHWQEAGDLSVHIEGCDITRHLLVYLRIKSSREYHAAGDWDHEVLFVYQVLPSKL